MTLNRQGLPTSCPHPPGRPTSSLNGTSCICLTHNLILTDPYSPVSTLFIAPRCTRRPQPQQQQTIHMRMHGSCGACGGWAFCGASNRCVLFSFFFRSCPFAHTNTQPLTTLTWPEAEAAAPSQGIDDNHTCTHIACITHLCPLHGFCMWPMVGIRPTTLFAPQRDRCR